MQFFNENIKAAIKQRLYRFKNFLRGREWYYLTDAKCRLITRGDLNSQWTFCPENLHPDSVVYSFGVGYDISFDEAVVNEFGVKVFLFDPTPESAVFIRELGLSANYAFESTGIADFDGAAKFYIPENQNYNHSFFPVNSGHRYIEVEVNRLSTICKRHGHVCIDLLKMDIEGAEYAVIPDILSSGIKVRQLLIEFHHRFPGNHIRMTRKVVQLLRNHGYKLVYVSAIGEEFTFIKNDPD